jgi:hypothetical protein
LLFYRGREERTAMINRKKNYPDLPVPVSRFSRSIPTKVHKFFSARLSADYAKADADFYRPDLEEVALGYESGWPSNCKKLN